MNLSSKSGNTRIANFDLLEKYFLLEKNEDQEIILDDFFLKSPKFFEFLLKILNKGRSPVIYSDFDLELSLFGKFLSFLEIYSPFLYKVKFLVDLNLKGNVKKKSIKNIQYLELLLKKYISSASNIIYTLNLEGLNSSIFSEISSLKTQIDVQQLRLRFAPLQGKSYREYINNSSIGDFLLEVLKYGTKNNIKISFDCCIYPCMFSKKNLKILNSLSYYSEEIQSRFKYKCPAATFVCSSLGKIYHCPPLEKETQLPLYLDPISLAPDMYKIKKEMESKFLKLSESTLPQECLICEYRISNICRGICPALTLNKSFEGFSSN